MSVLERLASLFAPDDCLVCGREGLLLCLKCQTTLPPPPGFCFDCSASCEGVACAPCLSKTGLYSLRAATHYTGASQALVARLKFESNQSAGRIMAHVMSRLKLPDGCIVTHMPATAPHIRQRGFDQAQLISQNLKLPPSARRMALLARSGSQHQFGADREQRLTQLSQALRVLTPARVRGASVVVIDDVLTTGSSLRAASTILLEAGAARVEGLVFAQAITRRPTMTDSLSK